MSKFYDVLGVTVGSDSRQVKAAFHALAKSSHPDVNTNDVTAENRFKAINEAYEILSDPERRAAYDLGIKHKDVETRWRVRKAIAVTAASFLITVGCGLYFPLSDAAHQFRRQSAELPLAQVAPEPSSDIRQSEQAGKNHEALIHGTIASAPVPQPAAQPVNEKHPTATPANEGVATTVAVGLSGPFPSVSNADARREQTPESSREPPSQTEHLATPPADESESIFAVKTQGPISPQLDLQVQREQALRLHAKGMEQIARGNVSAARMFFVLAAKAGSTRSMRALAGTYDPVQLDKLKVLGVQPDLDAARKWYEKADDLDAPTTTERGVRKEMETSVTAADKPATDLTQFRAAYTSGDGLAYVVINDEKGGHLYRYGDISRSNAKDDMQAYTLYACNTPHVLTPQKAEDNASLLRATVVNAGDPRFLELDAKYLSGCNNPRIKSAIPKIATMR
jgi:curved DNA-binding protein CbpA